MKKQELKLRRSQEMVSKQGILPRYRDMSETIQMMPEILATYLVYIWVHGFFSPRPT